MLGEPDAVVPELVRQLGEKLYGPRPSDEGGRHG